MSGKVNQVIFQEGLDDEFRHKYSYDGDNKLTQVHTSLDGIYWTLEAKYFYYAHGPLARVEIGEHNIQGVDYYYTLQGWIKGVNSPEGTFGKDGTEDNPSFNTDEFAYSLHYFEGDYTARGTSANPNNSIFGSAFNTDEDYSLFTGFYDHTEPSGNSVNGIPLADSYDRKSLYNGNVAAMTTSIAHFGRQEDGNGRATQSMNYRYDQLHRIAAASSKQWNPTTGVWESQTLGKAYQTSYQYDRNGNIQKLFRRNQAGDVIDNLKYSYDPVKKNQLYRVADQATGSAAQEGLEGSNHLYEYDEIGNLIKNGSDGIQTIIWNIQGKVEKVVRNTATITYRYDASGNRITKQVATTTTHHINYYLRDATGSVLAIYEYDDKPTNTHQATIEVKEIPIYGGSRLGQYRTSYSTIDVEGEPTRIKDKPTALGQRVYEFSNHLQNVLVVLADFKVPVGADGTATEFKAIVVSANDYYPFGMVMEGRKYYDPNYDYRYGFNGKEDDKDFGDKQLIQDYGFRLYNPAIARFLSVDPLAPDYPELTVYQFASNTPIQAIDLDGLEMFGVAQNAISQMLPNTITTTTNIQVMAGIGIITTVTTTGNVQPAQPTILSTNNFSSEAPSRFSTVNGRVVSNINRRPANMAYVLQKDYPNATSLPNSFIPLEGSNHTFHFGEETSDFGLLNLNNFVGGNVDTRSSIKFYDNPTGTGSKRLVLPIRVGGVLYDQAIPVPRIQRTVSVSTFTRTVSYNTPNGYRIGDVNNFGATSQAIQFAEGFNANITTGVPNTIGFTTFSSNTTYTTLGNVGWVGAVAPPVNRIVRVNNQNITIGQFLTLRANVGVGILQMNGVNIQNINLLNGNGVGQINTGGINANTQIRIRITQITDTTVGFQ